VIPCRVAVFRQGLQMHPVSASNLLGVVDPELPRYVNVVTSWQGQLEYFNTPAIVRKRERGRTIHSP
jgi:hypothetical protein